MKVGLFFGTFNPIHIGHLILAQYFLEHTDLNEVWFVVTPHNPHKKKSTLLDDRTRLYLTELAIHDYPGLRAIDDEFHLPQPNYTTVTLAHLRDKHPQKEFVLIMGMDNLSGFTKWRNWENILENHELYVYPRPGFDRGAFENHERVHTVDAPQIELSATFIRQAIKAGKRIDFMLPPKVLEYVLHNGLYR